MQEQNTNDLWRGDVQMCLRRGLWQKTKRKNTRLRQRLSVNAFGLRASQKQLQANELECKVLWRELVAESNLCTQKEHECKDLRVEVCAVQKTKE